MRRAFLRVVLLTAATVGSASAATPADGVRATFDRFVAAQNAHDLKALQPIVLDSPKFLWITRATPIWGREEALKRIESPYSGTWHLEPEAGEFRIVDLQPGFAQIFVPIVFTIGSAGQPPQDLRFLMDQVLVKSKSGWQVASILPIPVPPPAM